MKRSATYLIFLCSLWFLLIMSCGDSSEMGGCSVACGGLGSGRPFSQTNYKFINEQECKDKGEAKGCKASYCPPTGNSDDCYQVYP